MSCPNLDTPTTATVRHKGTSTSMSLKLLWRTPRTPMTVGKPSGTPISPADLRGIYAECWGRDLARLIRADHQNPSLSFTRITVIRPGAADLLMARMLLTPLGMPYAWRAR